MNRLGEYAGGSELAYQNWLNQADPTLAQATQQAAQPGDDWATAVARAIQVVGLAQSQRQLLQVQMQRAQQGLPPLNSNQYGLGVNVGLSPDVLKIAGLGLAVVAALFLLKRKR